VIISINKNPAYKYLTENQFVLKTRKEKWINIEIERKKVAEI
jgi:hypothetical protein